MATRQVGARIATALAAEGARCPCGPGLSPAGALPGDSVPTCGVGQGSHLRRGGQAQAHVVEGRTCSLAAAELTAVCLSEARGRIPDVAWPPLSRKARAQLARAGPPGQSPFGWTRSQRDRDLNQVCMSCHFAVERDPAAGETPQHFCRPPHAGESGSVRVCPGRTLSCL